MALRRLACATGQPQCQGCALRTGCGYSVVFDPAPPARPLHPSFNNGLPAYVIEPPALGARELQAGDAVHAALHLLPPAHAHLPLLRLALPRAAGQLLQPAAFEAELHPPQPHALPALPAPAHSTAPAPAPAPAPAHPAPAPFATFALRWHTPLNLRQAGRPITSAAQLTMRHLVGAWHRRHMQWCQLSGQPPADAQAFFQAGDACQLQPRHLVWHELDRRSNRQQRTLPLSGLLGSAHLHGPAPAIATLHTLASQVQPLGMGKETAFGLGRYQLGAPRPAA